MNFPVVSFVKNSGLASCFGNSHSNEVVPAPTKFHFTSHAKKRCFERAISESEITEVVTSPDTKKQQYRGNHGGFNYLFSKKYDSKTLHVVAEIHKRECYFVTGYWT